MSKFLLGYTRRFNSLSRDHLTTAICGRLYVSAPHFRLYSTDGNGETKASNGSAYDDDIYPNGEFVFRQRSEWEKFLVKTRLFFAPPWKRVKSGSVLKIVLRGEITDQLRSFSGALSLPQICVNFEKAAYDPRIAGIYLHIDNLNCGWGKLEEIRRHVLDFKKSVT